MVVGRRGRTPRVTGGDCTTPNPIENDAQRKEISDYEQSREERIQENLQRMQKLGIVDLSLKLKSLNTTPKPRKPFSRKTPTDFSPFPPSGPTRRSSRLQNATPVSYCEVDLNKKEVKLKGIDDFLGSRPEVYTEEHEKLLGSTEMSWTLFVDGCGKDGKRIYDPVTGKTCHQCRQKTLGHRTHCSKCGMVQGQFCGDCLYMRYGEHVLEANQNPNWICPVCRGICNCSLCRQSKGWPPTGALYRKISSLGYKSVAHYLVQTRHAETETGIAVSPSSVKESEPFTHVDATLGEEVVVDCNNTEVSTNSQHGDKISDNNLDAPRQEERKTSSDNDQVKSMVEIKTSSDTDQIKSMVEIETADISVSPKLNFDKNGALQSEIGHEPKDNKDCESPHFVDQHFNSSLEPESSPKPRETSVNTTEPAGDSIAGRLKQRLFGDICLEADQSIGTKDIPAPAPAPAHAKMELENVSFQVSADTSVDVGQASVDDSGRLKQSLSGDICPEADVSIGNKDIPAPAHAKVELDNGSFQVSVDTSVHVGESTVDDSGSLKCMGTEEIEKEGQLSAERKNGTLGFRQKKKPTIFSFPGKPEANNGTCLSPVTKRKSSTITEVYPDSVAGRLRQRRCRSRIE